MSKAYLEPLIIPEHPAINRYTTSQRLKSQTDAPDLEQSFLTRLIGSPP